MRRRFELGKCYGLHERGGKSIISNICLSVVHPTYIRTALIDKVHGQGKFKPLLLEPEPVVKTIMNHILSGNSGQIFLPGRFAAGASLRGWPSWLQEAVRSTQQNVLAH